MIFLIERDGTAKTVSVASRIDPKTKKHFVGISYKPEEFVKKYSVFPAIARSITKTINVILQSLSTIWGLLTGNIGLNLLEGPIAIAQASGAMVRAGIVPFMSLWGFLSIQIGMFNLLPFIPILDGGKL
jgi:regulator of sigma E protease